MIEEIKKALQEMTHGSDWTNFNDSEDSKTVFEYSRLTEMTCDIIADCQTLEMAQFIANVPEYFRYLIGEVERLQHERDNALSLRNLAVKHYNAALREEEKPGPRFKMDAQGNLTLIEEE